MKTATLNLVHLMSAFYQQIARVKYWIQHEQLAQQAQRILQLQNLPNEENIAVAVSLYLHQWLGEQRVHWQEKLTDRQIVFFDKTCFAMVALADEIFILEQDWVGRDYWHQVLLEERVYDSCSAGVTLFREIDKLLDAKQHDPMKVQLAAVYLLTLRLGFWGRYRDDIATLDRYRQQLFKIVSQHQKRTTHLVHPQGYEYNLVSQQEQRLAPLSNWYRGTAYLVTFYLLSGGVAWWLLNQGLAAWSLT